MATGVSAVLQRAGCTYSVAADSSSDGPGRDWPGLARCARSAEVSRPSARGGQSRAIVCPMAQRPVSPDGSPADRLTFRVPNGTKRQVAAVAGSQNMTPAEYVRSLLLADLAQQLSEEVSSKAS